MLRMSDFDDYPFYLPQNWGKRMDFLKIFFTSEEKILESTSCQIFTTFNDYSENDLDLKLVDDFLPSRYASLTTKSSHFVWSITSRNLNRFQ